jgi:hypothetical protein
MMRTSMLAVAGSGVALALAGGCGKKKAPSSEPPPDKPVAAAQGPCAGRIEVEQLTWDKGECGYTPETKRTFFVSRGDDGKYLVTTPYGLVDAAEQSETADGCRIRIQEGSSHRDETMTMTYQLVVAGDQVQVDGQLDEESYDHETDDASTCTRKFTARATRHPLAAKDLALDPDKVKEAFAELWKGDAVVNAAEECPFPALAAGKPVTATVKVEVSAYGHLGRLWIDGQDQGTFDERCMVGHAASEMLTAPNPSGRDGVVSFSFAFPAGSAAPPAADEAAAAPRAALTAPPEALSKLLGEHKLSLQWIGTKRLGIATVTNRDGVLELHGRQDRGEGDTEGDAADFVSIDGVITEVTDNEFKFRGTIVSRISFISSGSECRRDGEYSFAIKGKRRYWRLQQMENPCDRSTDYVDIYLR